VTAATLFIGPAANAAAGPASTSSPNAASSASSTPTPPATAKTAPKQVFKPQQPAKAGAAAPISTSALRTAKAASARALLAHTGVSSTCSGAISPDVVYPCDAPSSSGTDSFTVTLGTARDLLIFQVLSTSGSALPITITPPGGSAASCQAPTYYQLPACSTSAAGTYTVQIANGGSNYTIAYLPLLSDTSCTAANPSFADTTPLQGTVPAGSAGVCYTLDVPSGHILHADSNPNGSTGLVTVYDSTGAQICFDDQGDCTLTGTAPYRVVDNYSSGSAYSYAFRIKDVTDPAGCLSTAPGVYGVAPDSSSPVLCRMLTVTASGNYQIYAVSPTYSGISGTLYTPAGTSTCTNGGPFCQLAAGTYNYVLDEVGTYTADFGVVFMAASQSQGCTAAGDSDFQSGDATGTFAGVGAEACLTLPTASGKSVYLYSQLNADGTEGTVQFVVDATGAQQCAGTDFSYFATCALSGTAPFRVVLNTASGNGTSPDSAYRLLVQRTDSTAGCADWPQSGYGTSWGASVSLTKQSNFGCLSIPAAEHSTGEMIDYFNNANTVDGSINIRDTSGAQVCVGASTTVCTYKSGANYLALIYLVPNTSVQSDTFHVVRRDASQTAPCATPASTTVGGPSTGFDLTSDIDAVCYRATAASTDRLYFSVRTESPYGTGAVLEVANAAGTIVCRQWGSAACPVTGSTSYQAIVIASGYNGVTIATHLDAIRVGTASGWASQCTAHSLSAQGWAPISGTLSESTSTYCAVVSVQSGQWWNIYGADTATAAEQPALRVFSTADWSGGSLGLCAGMTNDPALSAGCQASSNDSGQAVLIATLGTVAGSTGFSLQGVCQLGCAANTPFPAITSISPASQPQGGANQIVVSGTNLNLGTVLELMSNGSQAAGSSYGTPVSVNAAGTSLTYRLDTSAVAPGKYDIGIGSSSSPYCPTGQTSSSCLFGAYTVTAGRGANSDFVTVTPKRILDTRIGLGAPKKQIAPISALPLTVEGVDGVPTSGVTAVELELTAVNEVGGGSLIAYAYGASRPSTSDLDFAKGQVVTNLVTVPVGSGKIELYNQSGGGIDLIADVVGYTRTGSGSLYTALSTPTRILDTASGLGAAKAELAGLGTLKLTVAGAGGVPASGVTAVALDVSTRSATVGGYLIAYPYGSARPNVTDLTYPATQPVTSLIVVPVVQGAIDLYNAGGKPVNLTADVVGYYSASGAGYQPVTPVRVLDTRSGLGGAGGAVASDGVAMLPFSSLSRVPSTGAVTAEVLDVVVTAPQHSGTLTVTIDGEPLPGLANLSYAAGETIADQVVVPQGATLDFYNGSGGTVQVVADVEGYYTD
jgi:hypothetical protein